MLNYNSHVHQVDCKDLMQQAQIFVYANGNNNPPTAIDLNKSLLKELLFNQSPTKVYFYRMNYTYDRPSLT